MKIFEPPPENFEAEIKKEKDAKILFWIIVFIAFVVKCQAYAAMNGIAWLSPVPLGAATGSIIIPLIVSFFVKNQKAKIITFVAVWGVLFVLALVPAFYQR